MKIKVCGMKEPENIRQVAALKPDYMGFICYDKTPRFIGDLATEALPDDLKKVGVFVNEDLDRVKELIGKYHFDVIQLHGSETPAYCEALKGLVEVWKAFGIDDRFDFDMLKPYEGKVDYFLFDTKTVIPGGSGQTFDWTKLNEYQLAIPFFLSGGLSLENIEQVLQIRHPMFFGVDLNSRFETAPGVKDIEKLNKAFALLRQPATNEI